MPKNKLPFLVIVIGAFLLALVGKNSRLTTGVAPSSARIQNAVRPPAVVSTSPDPLIQAIPWIVWTLIVSVGSVSLYILWNEVRLQKRLSAMDSRPQPRYPTPPQKFPSPPPKPQLTTWNPEQAKPTPIATSPNRPSWKEEKLYNDLKVLLRGDVDKLKRLMRLTMIKNPGKDMEWCYEKTIWDLERDRRV